MEQGVHDLPHVKLYYQAKLLDNKSPTYLFTYLFYDNYFLDQEISVPSACLSENIKMSKEN